MKKTQPENSKKPPDTASDDILHRLIFNKSIQPNIITVVSSGKIILANMAACKFLGYSRKELLTKYRVAIFKLDDGDFKKMLNERVADGHSIAAVTLIRKSGTLIPCEIASTVFMDDGIEKSITSITDKRKSILEQKKRDIQNEKIVADNIVIAELKQKVIDIKKEKVVAENIVIAETKQKAIDVKKEKIVAENIVIAETKQKAIDVKKEKVVADNIVIAETKQKAIDVKKEKIVAENIVIAKTKQKAIDVKKEKIVAENIVIAESKQKIIDIKKEKTVSGDIVLAQERSDARLEGNNEWIKHIAKVSYDVMWDLDIATGSLYLGDSIEEVFGYAIKDNRMDLKDFISYIVPFEKERAEKKLLEAIASGSKTWSDAFLFKRHDGSVASTTSRASIVRDENGKAIRLIGAMQDVSRIQELEKQLKERIVASKEQNDVFQLAAKLSYDGIWDWNLLTNDFYLGEGFEDLFGGIIKDRKGNILDWSQHLHPDDKAAVETGLQEAIASTAKSWEHTYRFIRANGSTAEVFGRANIIRDASGKACRMIGAVHDIHKQRMLEEKLKQEIDLKEMQIAAAAEDAKDTERSDIGKELHDNVNQLLGASKMYLEMAKGGGANSAMYIGRSSEYTFQAIEEIRKLTKGLTTDIIKDIGLCAAIENTTHDMMEVNPLKVSFLCRSFTEDGVNDKFKLNLYRIIQEHLNNISKHAKAANVSISLEQDVNSVFLVITDDGAGFDTSKKQKGIGIENIKNRAISYKGKASFVSETGQGCVLSVTFPLAASADA